ncbi:YIP1 family protein [Paenibacillus sp. IITD108]|uniref:YIP1 family protein n=1 Tax=Paenibacillus sp. IITD108 TaxID=3116649 RepID=UPI002F40476D
MQRKWLTVLIVVGCLMLPRTAGAEEPYYTYTVDSYDRIVSTQPAYASTGVIAQNIYIDDGNGGKVYSPLKRPQDLFIDAKDEMYIADTDNNRIVHLDPEGNVMRVITVPESPLNSPQGVFVDDKGDIFIADTGNKRVIRLDPSGQLVHEYAKPQSRFIDESFSYEPSGVSVDRRGFVYVIPRGSYQGIVQFDPEGRFYGFFGTNWTEASLMDRIKKNFYTKEQLSRQKRLLPAAISSIHIDEKGYLYSVSASETEQIKKLNIRGDNLWGKKSFGEMNYVIEREQVPPQQKPLPQFADITVDRFGNLTAIEKTKNIIYQYDANGELLFFWAGPVSVGVPRAGLNQSPVAIASNSQNELFILDDNLNLIQAFKPTTFGETVYRAFRLMQEGKYAESVKDWEEIVRINAHFSPAYKGLADAAYYSEDFTNALELYQQAGSETGYSEAFWRLRLEWFQQNFSLFATLIVVLFVLFKATKKLIKPGWRRLVLYLSRWRKYRIINQLRHAFTIMRHPIDGFVDLRFLNMGGYWSAGIILLLSIAAMLGNVYLTSFTFNPYPVNERSGITLAFAGGAIWLSWVICNYLVGSIRHGEARYKDVFVGGAYALFPFVLFAIPLALVSNVMTLNEEPIYHFLQYAIYIWCALLFFWKIQALQNYTVWEAVVNVLLTAFTMLMLWVLLFIIAGLFSETINFIQTIYQEVSM